MKIIRLGTVNEFAKEIVQEIDDYGDYSFHRRANLTENEAIEIAKGADILIIAPSALKPVTKRFINSLPKLRHIALVTVGYEWVDIEACQENDVSVSRPLGANSEAVAEHTFGLLIDLAKRITEFDRDVRTKQAYDFRNYQGTELYGKTLGIIGLGNVGHRVCRISRSFDMNVLAFDRSEESTDNYEIVDLQYLLENSDFIAVCIPLTEETKGLIGQQEIALMKERTILANTAREKIVNKKAVLDAIESGKLGGYGVDTSIMTPIQPDDRYLKYPNVIVNPHNAFNTSETEIRVNEMVVDNVTSFIKGGPKNLIDKTMT